MPQATSSKFKNIFRFINAPEGLVGAIQHLNQKKKSTGPGNFTSQPQPLLQLQEQTQNPVIEKSREQGDDLDPQFDSEGGFHPSQIITTISKQKPPTASKRGAGIGAIESVPERSSTQQKTHQPQQEAAVMDDQVFNSGVGQISPSRNSQVANDEPKKVVEAAAEITPRAPAQVEKAANQPPRARVQLEAYKAINEVAKMTTAARTKRKVQSRKAWTDLETETLINLIQDHGTSWKVLKDKDLEKVLLDRDQTSLKDKARNIKLDYLKWVIITLYLYLSISLFSHFLKIFSQMKTTNIKLGIDETRQNS